MHRLGIRRIYQYPHSLKTRRGEAAFDDKRENKQVTNCFDGAAAPHRPALGHPLPKIFSGGDSPKSGCSPLCGSFAPALCPREAPQLPGGRSEWGCGGRARQVFSMPPVRLLPAGYAPGHRLSAEDGSERRRGGGNGVSKAFQGLCDKDACNDEGKGDERFAKQVPIRVYLCSSFRLAECRFLAMLFYQPQKFAGP